MLKKCSYSLMNNCKLNINNWSLLKPLSQTSDIHTSVNLCDDDNKAPKHWEKQNNYIYPPQNPGEERRPAFVVHMKSNIKYSPKTMWYIACFVRGLSVDEAVKQLSYIGKKGAIAAKETILEAQKMAVEKHNVEFKSNLWVSESFVGKGITLVGLRRRGKGHADKIKYRHCHYFVRLEEGKPPKHYYLPLPQTKEQLLDNYLKRLRERKIPNTL